MTTNNTTTNNTTTNNNIEVEDERIYFVKGDILVVENVPVGLRKEYPAANDIVALQEKYPDNGNFLASNRERFYVYAAENGCSDGLDVWNVYLSQYDYLNENLENMQTIYGFQVKGKIED
jgi:hypothetical protein